MNHDGEPRGTVYGTLLNFQREWGLWAPRMDQDPYKAAPQAPVLYIKTANTFNRTPQLTLQDGVTEVGVGASLGLVMGEGGQAVSLMLLNDWSVPHTSYYRPPIKFRCRDGYLGVGASLPWAQVDAGALRITVHINAQPVQTVDLATLVRPVAQLLADVTEFMTLQAGDVLMVGTDCLADGSRPLARAGDTVQISAPGFTPLVQHLVAGGAA